MQSTVFNGQVLTIPGAYVSTAVQNTANGLATTGVLMVVGEAESGADYSAEVDLDNVTFGPDQISDVMNKYKSGPVVDAFRGAVAAASDPQIQGSFQRMVIMKTNVGTKASGILDKVGGGTYATLYDQSYGKNGNLINYTVTQKTAEVVPTTGLFTYLFPIADYDISIRVNGAAVVTRSAAALETPAQFVTSVDGLTGVDAAGGANRNVITVSGTLALAVVSGNAVTITRSIAWAVNPSVGDTLYIPVGSVIAGVGNANVGSYVVTAVTNTVISATKLRNASGSPTVVTAPVAVGATAIVAVTDVQCYAPVSVSVASGSVIPGVGKSLEINELSTGTGLFSYYAYNLNPTPVSWISKSGSPQILKSSAEYGVTTKISRQSDQVSNTWDVAGKVALLLGYSGTTCSVVINGTTLATTVTGGSGTNLNLTLADFATISDLSVYINAQTGYNASVDTAAVGQLPANVLDQVSTTAGTTWGNPTARIKVDAYDYYQGVLGNSTLAQLNNPSAQAALGFPVPSTIRFMSGGSKGSTSTAIVEAAIDALAAVQGNFLIPLFSRDASEDIVDALTDSGSTYQIDAINAYAKTHVLLMSQIKRRRNRQAFLSKRASFVADKNAAANLSEGRCSMAFQDFKDVGQNGIVQFQPWMGAIKAAGMQAAGFYRAIFNKGINCSGVLQAAGDFKDTSDSNLEDALANGLLPAKRLPQGGFTWVSDQTTYTRDNNFVFNSIQAIYAMDVVALTIAQRMEQAFLGQSLADVSAGVALSTLSGICFDLLRLKLIAPSDQAAAGFRNASIRIVGPVMYVTLEVFLATALYFIPIQIQVNQVTSTASL